MIYIPCYNSLTLPDVSCYFQLDYLNSVSDTPVEAGDKVLFLMLKEGQDSDEILPENEPEKFSIDGLYELLLDRRATKPEGSYTSYLFEKGLDKILKKVGEESTEVIIAAHARDRRETVYELADLAYHALVLMAELGITPDEVRAELAGRHVIDHKVKQEKMT